ncbi:unnamed protein product [Dibothriocephalus latus]|uniref:Metalloendopeptidase n=1 Tax=Dibothriocephalus latus TaxID=60516 RepID=A0A3P7LVQ9_DIBLA|nr:unnamed protein product [Dibothriocephalus latus]
MNRHIRTVPVAYVDILLPSIGNEQKTSWQVDSLKEPYDYDSIMHYAQWIYQNGKMTEQVRPKDPNAKIGQRKKLSEGDIKQANKLYSCPSCGRTLLQSSDKFSSPELPLGTAIVCKWRILAKPKERIVLNFIRFHVRPTGGQSLVDAFQTCTDTYVEVHDGYEGNSKSLGV